MSKTQKNYPSIFKTKVVLSALREDVPVSELSLKYGGSCEGDSPLEKRGSCISGSTLEYFTKKPFSHIDYVLEASEANKIHHEGTEEWFIH